MRHTNRMHFYYLHTHIATLVVTDRISFRNHSKGGETIVFYHKGARKGLDLKNNIQQLQSRGARIN